MLFRYQVFRIEFSEKFVEHLPSARLPRDWQVEPPPASAKQLGDAWVRQSRSAVLALPSIIIPDELNYLLNPAHPDSKHIIIGKPAPFAFDPRLLT
jgi:RES domain-containing protein